MTTITTNTTIYQSNVNAYTWPVTIQGTTTVTLGENLISTAGKIIHFIVTGGDVTIDGNNNTVNVTAVTHYPGLVESTSNNTKVKNVGVKATPGITTDNGEGWIGSASFCGVIESCYSTGDIGGSCGGIVGDNAGSGQNKTCDISGCYSTGAISGDESGGIAGIYCGRNGGNVTITSCYSTGAISGQLSGGIAGSECGFNGGTVTITSC